MIPIATPLIGEEEKQAVLGVLDSGMLASGQKVKDFEGAFAAYIGARHGVACSSGTTALELALRALGIGAGDKVITTAFSFIASSNSIVYTGARPVFADIDEKTFTISPQSVEACIRENPDAKALLIVHLFGHPCDMDAITALAKKHGLLLAEDCAQSHGAKWRGKMCGTFGDAAAFSFYPTKNMTTSEGGMVLTDHDKMAERLRLLVNHGMQVRYRHDVTGYNYRMTNIAAAIGEEQLKKLDRFNAARRQNAAYYRAHIRSENILVPHAADAAYHVYHQYTLRVLNGKRQELIAKFEKAGIGYGVFYPYSLPEQPCYREMDFEKKFEATDRVKTEVLSIPVHPALEENDLAVIVKTVNSL